MDRWTNLVAAAEFYILFNDHRPARGFYLLIHDDNRWKINQPDSRERFLCNVERCCIGWMLSRGHAEGRHRHVLTLDHFCHTLGVAEHLKIARVLADEMKAGNDEPKISMRVDVLLAKHAVVARVPNSAN
ncbi:hypothetical protein [Noviherbaspirillum pedocola]|uniref:Uncharacterized protein n=1 Tax=Noviherbaspirillum pedocola TaxID=2801341 RepID=A0A934SUJ2_9BURK|nr:hypothetical protein [Noviherbaspirillum pedocola]MBK4735528.1 hypothetical protein [Noviherbaspirillum pedocola]